MNATVANDIERLEADLRTARYLAIQADDDDNVSTRERLRLKEASHKAWRILEEAKKEMKHSLRRLRSA
jgi:hypothetical protein